MAFDEGKAYRRITRRYKYVLAEDLALDLPVPMLAREPIAELLQEWEPGATVPPAWVRIERRWVGGPEAQLVDHIKIAQGYAWDGASAVALDTRDFMRASCVHDALYQMIRDGALPEGSRAAADANMRAIARQDGMPLPRAWWTWAAVRLFGGKAARVAA